MGAGSRSLPKKSIRNCARPSSPNCSYNQPVQTLQVDLGASSYPISIGAGLLTDRGLLEQQIPGRDLLIVTNATVAKLYLAKLSGSFSQRHIADCILPDGEQHKTLQTAGWVFDALVGKKMNRDATVLALGGGVVGDIAGFAAACYQRGIGYVQIPTTLLAQVDSSVGGKTGVNHSGGKNLIGAFYQPAVSNALTRLRKLMDDPLFARTRYGVQPTTKAHGLIGPVREALSLIQGQLEVRRQIDLASYKRLFRVLVFDPLESIVLPPVLRQIADAAPGIAIECVRGTPDFAAALRGGAIDLACFAH